MVINCINKATIIYLLLLVTILLANLTYAVDASLDRYVVEEQETLTLTLSATNSFEVPDLSNISEFLEVINTSQSSRTSIINNKIIHAHKVIIKLFALKAGQWIIPSYAFIRSTPTKELKLTIKASNNTSVHAATNVISLNMTSDLDQAYVQQQVIVTTQLLIPNNLYQNLSNASLTELSLDNASIVKISKQEYSKIINGQHFYLVTSKHAIFAQKSGTLLIPSRIFNAIIGFRKKVKHYSDALEINILPAAYTDDFWLPAENLTLKIDSDKNNKSVNTSDAITKKISLTALGVQAEQLPDIHLPQIEGVKIYTDKLQTNNQTRDDNIIGTKSIKLVIVPTITGKIVIPAINISWWDTRKNQRRTASIKSFSLNVTAKLLTDDKVQSSSVPLNTNQTNDKWLWLIIIFILFLWFITLILWFCHNKKINLLLWTKERTKKNKNTLQETVQNKLNNGYTLRQACKNNDPVASKNALLLWAQKKLNQPKINSLNQLNYYLEDKYHPESVSPLITAIKELDEVLYGKVTIDWEGKLLLSSLNKIKELKTDNSQEINYKKLLYPTK